MTTINDNEKRPQPEEALGQVTEAEILTFLHAVETGEVTLTPLQDPQAVYAGTVEYAASNDWRITIFNDCNDWDYIDRIRTADGRECDYDYIYENMPQVEAYAPSDDVMWSVWRIPGYMKFRCLHCGQRIKGKYPDNCPNCKAPMTT